MNWVSEAIGWVLWLFSIVIFALIVYFVSFTSCDTESASELILSIDDSQWSKMYFDAENLSRYPLGEDVPIEELPSSLKILKPLRAVSNVGGLDVYLDECGRERITVYFETNPDGRSAVLYFIPGKTDKLEIIWKKPNKAMKE